MDGPVRVEKSILYVGEPSIESNLEIAIYLNFLMHIMYYFSNIVFFLIYFLLFGGKSNPIGTLLGSQDPLDPFKTMPTNSRQIYHSPSLAIYS